MAKVSGEEHIFRRESLQGTTTVTFRSRRYHLPSVIVNQPHQLEQSSQGSHEECLLLNMGLYCPHCATKVQMTTKHQRLSITSDGQGGFITQPTTASHFPGQHPHHQAFHSPPYDRVQQQSLQALPGEGPTTHREGLDRGPFNPSEIPHVVPGHRAEESHPYIQELRYRPKPRQTQSLPNNNMGLEYGFIEQHEGTFSFEDHKPKPHHRSRLKELHTDSLKLQKRRQKPKLSDMGVHAESVIPEGQSPTSSQSSSKPGTPEGTLLPDPLVGFENPNFDFAAAENIRRYKEQQLKQKMLQRQDLMKKQAALQQARLQQQNRMIQQQQQQHQVQHQLFLQQQEQKTQQLVLQQQKQIQQSPEIHMQQQRHKNQKTKQQRQDVVRSTQGEVFVNNYALYFEHAKRKSMNVEAPKPTNGKRFFEDVSHQQQYWKQQEEIMRQKEQIKHQELYEQQQMLLQKHQERLYRQQQKKRRAQIPDNEPQRYNNLDKQSYSEYEAVQPQEQKHRQKEQIQRQQEERMRQYQLALQQQQLKRRKQKLKRQQQAEHQPEQPRVSKPIPFHAPEMLDSFEYPADQEMTSEKNIQVDSLPMEYLEERQNDGDNVDLPMEYTCIEHKENQSRNTKRERDHRHRERQLRKRHKKPRNEFTRKLQKSKSTSAVPDEYELYILEPTPVDEPEFKEINVSSEHVGVEVPVDTKFGPVIQDTQSEQTKLERLIREHKQNTVYYKEWSNTTEEQSFTRYVAARELYNRCVQEMKGLHETESMDFVRDQRQIVTRIRLGRRDSIRSDSSSTAPARSETSEASSSDLYQTKGGTFFAHVQHRGSIDSAEPVESPSSSLEYRTLDSTLNETDSRDFFPANIKYDAANKQHILSISAEGAIGGESSPPASFEEVDHSLLKYMEWLQTEEMRQKKLSRNSSSDKDEVKTIEEVQVVEPLKEETTEAVEEVKEHDVLNLPPKEEEATASKRSSYLEPQEDVVEVEKWDSNGTTYSVYLVTKKLDEHEEDYDVDINSEVIAMLDHSLESMGSDETLEDIFEEDKRMSTSSLDIPTIREPEDRNDVKFYISSNEFLEEADNRSSGSYRISEEELLDLQYRIPTILDENENSLFQSERPNEATESHLLLQVPQSTMNIESSDADDGEMQVDESAEEKEFERIMSAEDSYESTSEDEDMDLPRDPSFDIEEEVDDILENIEVETYSPTSTLSRAFTYPRKKKKPRMIRHVQPPEMVPILSAESNSEMTSSTSSNQEMLQNLDIQATQYHQLVSEGVISDCDDDDDDDEDTKKEDSEQLQVDLDTHIQKETKENVEEDTEEEAEVRAASPEAAFEVVVEAATEEGYGSDWPSDHDEFLPRVIKGKGKKTSDMFEYDFYHEKLNQKQTSSCECLADGASVGKLSDIGSDDLEKSFNEKVSEPDEIVDVNMRKNIELTVSRRSYVTSSMTSSYISDTSSLEQIIDDTMQLTESILSSCEKVETAAANIRCNNDSDLEQQPVIEKQDDEETKEFAATTKTDKSEEQKELKLVVQRQDSEIKQLERDSQDVEEMLRWSQENIHKQVKDMAETKDENDKKVEKLADKDENKEKVEELVEIKDEDNKKVEKLADKDENEEKLEETVKIKDGNDKETKELTETKHESKENVEELIETRDEIDEKVKEPAETSNEGILNVAVESKSDVVQSKAVVIELVKGEQDDDEEKETQPTIHADLPTRPLTEQDNEGEEESENEEIEKEEIISWSQDTVRKSSYDSLEIAEFIHVIDDIPEDEVYDMNEDERMSSDKESEHSEESKKSIPRSQSPNVSDAEVVFDTKVQVVEENFFQSSVEKLEEETRCLQTKSVDHSDTYITSEHKVCTYGEPIYTNRHLLLPKSPVVTKSKGSESGSEFDTKSFEELERIIALEESSEQDTITRTSISSETEGPNNSIPSNARVVLKEVETLETSSFTKTTTDVTIEHITQDTHESQQIYKTPMNLKTLAMAVVKSSTRNEAQREDTNDEEGASDRHSNTPESPTSAPGKDIEKKRDTFYFNLSTVKGDEVYSHPLVVRRQQGLLNRDTEFESLTSDAASDNIEVFICGTPSDSVADDSDSSSISLADKPKMDFLKPGTYINNDDSSVSDLFPDTDSESLDDDVFLSDTGHLEPENDGDSWGELLTDTASHEASFETPNLLSDTQAEDFLRHMLGIPEQPCLSDASDTEQAELQEDLSACLSDVCQALTSESESEAGEVLSEEVHTQEVTLVFAWPKNKSFVPSSPRNLAGKPYREIHVRKVTRVKDFDVEILEGPKIVYSKKKAIEEKDTGSKDNSGVIESEAREEESDQLNTTHESGIFSTQGDDTLQETSSENLNIDDLLKNLSDMSSEIDLTGEKSIQMHDRSKAWNIHAIPLVVPKPVGVPSSPSGVPSEVGTNETAENSCIDDSFEAVSLERPATLYGTNVQSSSTSDKEKDREAVVQLSDEVDSTAVDGVVQESDRAVVLGDELDGDLDDADDGGVNQTDDKKAQSRRTIIVTAVLRPKSELERQTLRAEDVCRVKRCDTCKSLVHGRKVASKNQQARQLLKCMKCSQMRLLGRVTKTASCKDVTDSSRGEFYSTNTWPPQHDRGRTTGAEHLKKLRPRLCQTDGRKSLEATKDGDTRESSGEQDRDKEVLDDPVDV